MYHYQDCVEIQHTCKRFSYILRNGLITVANVWLVCAYVYIQQFSN